MLTGETIDSGAFLGAESSLGSLDARPRLSGAGGSGAANFTYGSGLPGTAPLAGVTGNGSASYSYDATGDRTNAGTTTNDVYDAERRLVSWTISGGSGKEAYDGAGRRVAHQTTSGVTTTYYVGGLEEVDAASGAVTKYYATPAGAPAALRVGTNGVTYLATDGLGSVSEALDGSGNVTAAQLFGPYGQGRYTTGTMPTTKGYTGQRADAASGLDDYGARYYDPALAQFASADSAADGLNRYAYVAGNPTTRTDPTGHRMCVEGDPGCGGGSDGGGGTGTGGSSGGTGNGTGSGGDGGKGDGGKGGGKGGPRTATPECETDQCKRDRAIADLKDYYERQGRLTHLVLDIATVIADLLVVAADIIEAIVTKAVSAFIGLATDLVSAVADTVQLISDYAEFNGASASELSQLKTIAAFMQGLAGAAHLVATGAAIFSLLDFGLDGLFKQGTETILKQIHPQLVGLGAHLLGATMGYAAMTDDEIAASEDALSNESLPQLLHQCGSVKISCT